MHVDGHRGGELSNELIVELHASAAFNEIFLHEVIGDFDLERWRDSLQAVVERSDVLRTSFSIVDGRLTSAHSEVDVSVERFDATDWNEERLEAKLLEHAARR